MAFFDDLSKKASEIAAKTMQKTQELSETSKLNSHIAEEEKRIDNAYYQIGKLYVSLHGADNEEAFVGMVRAISESEQKINEFRKKIQDIKGIQRCENCGAEVPKGKAFCSSCGASMPKAEAAVSGDYVRCESCGASVKRGMRFCTSCGKPMMPVMVTTASAESATGTSENERLCPNCGCKVAGDVAFCTECGAKL